MANGLFILNDLFVPKSQNALEIRGCLTLTSKLNRLVGWLPETRNRNQGKNGNRLGSGKWSKNTDFARPNSMLNG